jgi:hypothetical protein
MIVKPRKRDGLGRIGSVEEQELIVKKVAACYAIPRFITVFTTDCY